ncbi:laminin B domain-containing protein [Moheibacter sediminis]|uniref:Por secretion system C-terminal sorting domain-containing protein n=1 Tax=Moheibacter sediminis TaxID=1434700 RepID=A0A1W1YKZ4_9FLAO|nr:laminin B domain-containing protein [Moheibacter sediminis]SMC36900.1 Por secretion system C-terminal sorting domain-containing protein [Moheibacter sediminis]
MKNLSISFIVLFVINFNLLSAQNIVSTFDSDDEGWLVAGDATSSMPQYNAEGGNPSGYISADDTAAGGVWVWSAPAKFLGDRSSSFGKNLSFDLAQSSMDSQFDDNDVLIVGENLTLALNLLNNPGIEWTNYSVKLDTNEDWRITHYVWGDVATDEQIQEVLSNVLEIKIRGEYVSGPDVGSLDNVILESENMSISEASNDIVKIYPNPTNGEVYFSKSLKDVSIYNLSGQKIELKAELNKVNISKLPAGIYILKGRDADQKLIQIKLIKN